MRANRSQLVFAVPALSAWAIATTLLLGASWIALKSLGRMMEPSLVPTLWGFQEGTPGWIAFGLSAVIPQALVVFGLLTCNRWLAPIPVIALLFIFRYASSNLSLFAQRWYDIENVDGWDMDPIFLAYFLAPYLMAFLSTLVIGPTLGLNAWRCLRKTPRAV